MNITLHLGSKLALASNFSKKYFLFLFIPNCLTSQLVGNRIHINRIRVGKIVQIDITKYLNPPILSSDTIINIVFITYPETEANSSLRIIFTKGRSHLEVRYLEKNIREELFKATANSAPIKVHFRSVPIGDSFRKKILEKFFKVITLNEEENRIEQAKKNKIIEIYDGANYVLWAHRDRQIFRTNIRGDKFQYPKCNGDSDLRYQIKTTNLQIIEDVKMKRFHEFKYLIYH